MRSRRFVELMCASRALQSLRLAECHGVRSGIRPAGRSRSPQKNCPKPMPIAGQQRLLLGDVNGNFNVSVCVGGEPTAAGALVTRNDSPVCALHRKRMIGTAPYLTGEQRQVQLLGHARSRQQRRVMLVKEANIELLVAPGGGLQFNFFPQPIPVLWAAPATCVRTTWSLSARKRSVLFSSSERSTK